MVIVLETSISSRINRSSGPQNFMASSKLFFSVVTKADVCFVPINRFCGFNRSISSSYVVDEIPSTSIAVIKNLYLCSEGGPLYIRDMY